MSSGLDHANPADALAAALVRAGADTVFGMPGGGPNLDVIGAVERAGLRFVLAHGETAACIMAGTYGLLTGRPAMALATRGPGAASAVNGVVQATLDRFPLLLVTDCVPGADRQHVGHQRIDQRALMAPITKGSGRLGGGAGDPEAIAGAALALAAASPRGAVHLDYDVGASCIPVTAATADGAASTSVCSTLGDPGVASATALVRDARRPVAVVGLGALDEAAAVRAALERLGCPVLTTYQAAGVLPEGHRQLAGLYTNGVIESAVLDDADVVLAVGLDPVEPMPGRWRYDSPVVSIAAVAPDATFVPATVSLVGAIDELLDAVIATTGAGATVWSPDAGAQALAAARAVLRAAATSRGFGPLELVDAVIAVAPGDVIATVDAGAHFLAVMPFWPVTAPLRLLISNGAATMGFAVPAAIGASLAHPGVPVVCFVGDGGLAMTMGELETIARLALPITVVVFDDAALSLIEVKQREGQGGAGAVRFSAIDLAGVGAAMGLESMAATSAAEVERQLRVGWDRPRLLDARIDPGTYRPLIAATRG